VGFAEGALVGACALDDLYAAGKLGRGRVVGLVALCASGRTELEVAREALESAPEALKGEAESILSALEAGKPYPNPSAYFADYFRPSIQGYLSSLFTRDIRKAFASLPCPALVVAGGSDLQTSENEVELLASSRSDIAYRVIPGMSHALKAVGTDEEKNYSSFTDASLTLADGLSELVAAFARGEGAIGAEPPEAAPEGALQSADDGASR
jgi:hypothetical protein